MCGDLQKLIISSHLTIISHTGTYKDCSHLSLLLSVNSTKRWCLRSLVQSLTYQSLFSWMKKAPVTSECNFIAFPEWH